MENYLVHIKIRLAKDIQKRSHERRRRRRAWNANVKAKCAILFRLIGRIYIVTCRLVLYTLHGNIRIYSHRADMQTEHQTKLFVKMNNSFICQCVFWQIQFAKKITSFPAKQTLNKKTPSLLPPLIWVKAWARRHYHSAKLQAKAPLACWSAFLQQFYKKGTT